VKESTGPAQTLALSEIDSAVLSKTRLTPAQRWFSLTELAVGGAIVIGHNIYHVVPNEVPILVVAGLVSLRLRNGGWGLMGLHRPTSWPRTVVIAMLAAAARILLGVLAVDPIAAHFWPPAVLPSGADQITGHPLLALRWLFMVWIFAAFGEEIGYRGYLITRAADAGDRSRAAYWAGVLIVSVLFGYGHYYKGPAGVLDSGMAGLILGATFILSGRNLWACILAHGFIDTFALVTLFLGWSS